MLIPLLILFFILVAGFGIENTFKILPPLIILGLLIYFLGWVAVRYFWIILPIWFVSKLLSNKNKGKNSTYSRTYRRTDDFFNSGSTNRTTYGGTFNSREEAEEKFGFLLKAFQYGAPPHEGIAFGLDRLVMLMLHRASIRDVIAFPKTQSAVDQMAEAPNVVTEKQLGELHIKLDLDEDKEKELF